MFRSLAKALTVAAFSSVAVLTAASPAAALCTENNYPPGTGCAGVEVSDSSVEAGSSITVTGDGFRPGARVEIRFDGKLVGVVQANALGEVQFSFKIPLNTPPGKQPITISGIALDGSSRSISTFISVFAVGQGGGSDGSGNGPGSGNGAGNGNGGGASGGDGGGLPFTGFELGAASLIGAGLVGAGTLIVAQGRRRKRHVPAVA